MIAFLLYLIGLVSVLVTLVLVAVGAPGIYNTLYAAYVSGFDQVLPALGNVATGLGWALTPFLGGLVLMGFARIMMLLGSIQHALKGPA